MSIYTLIAIHERETILARFTVPATPLDTVDLDNCETFTCDRCGCLTHPDNGAADEYYDTCDVCVAAIEDGQTNGGGK